MPVWLCQSSRRIPRARPFTSWASVSSSTKWKAPARIMLKNLLDLYHFTLMKCEKKHIYIFTYIYYVQPFLSNGTTKFKFLPAIVEMESILYVEQRIERLCSHSLAIMAVLNHLKPSLKIVSKISHYSLPSAFMYHCLISFLQPCKTDINFSWLWGKQPHRG